jgi:hypothetical protein
MYSFEQPELYSDYIVVSSPRIFIRDHATTFKYSGQQLLAVSTPLSGWADVGLISNVQIPVTRNITKLQLGIPKTTRKSFEASREAQVTLTFHEMALEAISTLMGVTQKNVMSMGAITSQANTGDAITTMAASDANKFVVGDKVTFWDVSGDALVGVEEVKSVSYAAGTVTVDGTWAVPPEAADILIAKAGTVASYSAGNKTITLGAGEANRFAAGDRLVFHTVVGDNLSAFLSKTDRVYVVSVDSGGAILNLSAAFTGTPVSGDVLAAYKSVEMLDPLGTIAEKSLLVFFDWVVNSVQRQVAIWYPKVTVAGSFAPDFKGGENFMDANVTFEVQSTSQVMTDGTTSTVLQIPFMFN